MEWLSSLKRAIVLKEMLYKKHTLKFERIFAAFAHGLSGEKTRFLSKKNGFNKLYIM
jgi:hypothetical protein